MMLGHHHNMYEALQKAFDPITFFYEPEQLYLTYLLCLVKESICNILCNELPFLNNLHL